MKKAAENNRASFPPVSVLIDYVLQKQGKATGASPGYGRTADRVSSIERFVII
jgi:hypothetical protein